MYHIPAQMLSATIKIIDRIINRLISTQTQLSWTNQLLVNCRPLLFMHILSSTTKYKPKGHYHMLPGHEGTSLTLCTLGNCSCLCDRLLTFFFQSFFFPKKSFRNTTRLSNVFDQDQDQHFVCPDLGPNCFQSLSHVADDKSRRWQKKDLNVD